MTTIGFIGSGSIGSTLERLAIAGGYDVMLSNSRGPETLTDLVSELGHRASAATPAQAAAAGDIVVACVPMSSYREIPVEPLAGKIVIDANNYGARPGFSILELDDESTTTSELIQSHLPQSRIVKAFNSIYFPHLAELARPAGSPERSTLPIAGDDGEAKQIVTGFLDAIGYDALDAGPLAEGWRFQRDTPAYCFPYFTERDLELSRTLTLEALNNFRPGPGVPAPRVKIEQALAEAKRYRDM